MKRSLSTFLSSKLYLWAVILGDIALSIPLIGYAINGSYMRYSGDDYCYGSVLTQQGFWKAQWYSYFHPQAYNGNRYSLTFFSDLSGLFRPFVNGILPALAILFWILGIVFVIHWAARLAQIKLVGPEKLFIAELLVFFTLYMSPYLPQSLFWRSGMLPYLAPLVVNAYLFGFILKQVGNKKIDYLGLFIVVCLAFIAGGFSEAALFLQLGYLSLLLIGCLVARQKRLEWAPNTIKIIGAAWISSFTALLLLALSPSNSERLLKFERPDFLSLVRISASSASSFIGGSIKSLPLPTFVLFLLSIGISWLILSRFDHPISLSRFQWLTIILLIPMLSFGLIFFMAVPIAYVQSSQLDFRALIIARLIMNVAIMAAGTLIGLFLHNFATIDSQDHVFLRLAMLTSLGAVCLYPIYAARNIYSEIPKYQRWASFWDARDSTIRAAAKNNTSAIEVTNIDHIIPFVAELSPNPNYWYNVCAAGYYGISSISANQPGWDTP